VDQSRGGGGRANREKFFKESASLKKGKKGGGLGKDHLSFLSYRGKSRSIWTGTGGDRRKRKGPREGRKRQTIFLECQNGESREKKFAAVGNRINFRWQRRGKKTIGQGRRPSGKRFFGGDCRASRKRKGGGRAKQRRARKKKRTISNPTTNSRKNRKKLGGLEGETKFKPRG